MLSEQIRKKSCYVLFQYWKLSKNRQSRGDLLASNCLYQKKSINFPFRAHLLQLAWRFQSSCKRWAVKRTFCHFFDVFTRFLQVLGCSPLRSLIGRALSVVCLIDTVSYLFINLNIFEFWRTW